MNIQDHLQKELTRLATAKQVIQEVLDRLGISYPDNRLDSLAAVLSGIRMSEVTREGASVTITPGFVPEEYTVTIDDLVSTGYVINEGDGSVYFQPVSYIDGELVPDGNAEAITEILVPDTGTEEPDYAKQCE